MFLRKSVCTYILLVVFLGFNGTQALGEHPEAEKLLPEKTVLFVKITNMTEFMEGFSNTAFQQMLRDEKVAPVIESLYGSVEDGFAPVEAEIGVSLDQLRTMISGEVCLALVVEKGQPISVVVFADYKGGEETADKLLDFGEGVASDQQTTIDTVDIGETTIRSIGDGENDNIHYFQKNKSICAATNMDQLRLVLARWQLELEEEMDVEFAEEMVEPLKTRTLTKNRKFLNVMKLCEGDEDFPPQAKAFIDPFELIRATQTGVAGTAALGILRGLGVDGLLGIGGSMTVNHEEFDSVVHLHVSLANPRAGLIKMMAIEPGDLEPESLFPPDVAVYMSANWNTITSFLEVEKIYDLFNGEGALAEELAENFTENFGVDLKEDILESLDGRMSMGQLNVDSGALNGQALVLALKLKDPGEFEDIFADLRDGINELADREVFTQEKYKSVEYFVLTGPSEEEREARRSARNRRRNEGQDDQDEPRERPQRLPFQIREPSPCLGIVGEYLVFSDSIDFMKEAINNERNPDDVLAGDPDYKSLLREVTRQLDGRKPALITYSRPAETFRMLFDAVKNEQTQAAIGDRAEDQALFDALKKAVVDNELPDFDDMVKYFPPAIGVMTNDETGFHYLAFSKKADLEDE